MLNSNEDIVSVPGLANNLGKRRQSIFKIIKKLKIDTIKLKGGEDSRGQIIAYVSKSDEARIRDYLRESQAHKISNENDTHFDDDQIGVFYLIQLEPELDPLRIKLGFTLNMTDRLRKHKCSAPHAKLLKSWPCKLLWEKTAIDCVSNGCTKIHTEVFKAIIDMESIIEKLDRFFNLMNQ